MLEEKLLDDRLEGKLNALKRVDRFMQWASPVTDVFHNIEDYLNNHIAVPAVLTGMVMEGLNLLSHPFDANLEDDIRMLLSGVLMGAGTAYLSKKLQKEAKDFPKTFSEKAKSFFWEHPVVPALIASGTYIYQLYGGDIDQIVQAADTPRVFAWAGLYTISYYAIGTVEKLARLKDGILNKSHYYDLMATWNEIKAFMPGNKNYFEHFEKTINYYELSLQENFQIHTAVNLFYNYLLIDKTNEALNLFYNLIEVMDKGDWDEESIIGKGQRVALRDGKRRLEEYYVGEKRNFHFAMSKLLSEYLSPKEVSPEELFNIVVEDEEDYMGFLLRGLYHKSGGKIQKARQDFRKFYSLLSEDEDMPIDFTGLGQSRRKTMVIDNPVFGFTVVMQEATPKQAAMTKAVSDILGERAALFVDYFEDEGILIQQRERGKYAHNLYDSLDFLSEKVKLDVFIQGIDILVDFQLSQPLIEQKGIVLDDVLLDDPEYYGNRLLNEGFGQVWKYVLPRMDSIVEGRLTDTINGVSNIIWEMILSGRLSSVMYWDANQKNFLLINPLLVKGTDFENTQIKLDCLDQISFTEFTKGALTPKQVAKIDYRYMQRTGRFDSVQQFLERKSFAGLIRHVEFGGYASRDYNNMESYVQLESLDRIPVHFQRGAEYADLIANFYVETHQAGLFHEFGEYLRAMKTQLTSEYEKELSEFAEEQKEYQALIKNKKVTSLL